jgi:hypothetical protein
VTLESTVRLLEHFLCSSCDAVVLEAGAAVFDLAIAKYSSSAEHGKCLLHLWSAERNIVRRVLEGEIEKGGLRLPIQRLRQARPSKLEICRERDRRTGSAKLTSTVC